MANIIDQIIQIDSIAQQKLDDAAHLKEQYEKKAKEKMADTNALIEQKAQAKIEKIRQEEAARAEQEKEEIRKQMEAALERLEKTYQATHEKLEEELYKNVLGL